MIVAGVLATTLAQPQVLARLPLQNLLKNELHLDRSSQRGVLLLGGAGLVSEAVRRDRDRRLSAVRQPPQELHPAERRVSACAGMAGADLSPRTNTATCCACGIVINVFMVGNQHRGRRLHGRNRPGNVRAPAA